MKRVIINISGGSHYLNLPAPDKEEDVKEYVKMIVLEKVDYNWRVEDQ